MSSTIAPSEALPSTEAIDPMSVESPKISVMSRMMNGLHSRRLSVLALSVVAPISAALMPAKASANTMTYGPLKTVSFDQCDFGERICSTGCGDVVATDAIDDLKKEHLDPYDMERILSPKFYVPGSGTRPEAFKFIAKRFGLHEKPGSLASAPKALKMGGVAVAEFDTGLAKARSGHPSSIAVNNHYVLLDRFRSDGRFAMADPHQGPDRHNETKPDGTRRYWTPHQLKQEGLQHVWTITP